MRKRKKLIDILIETEDRKWEEDSRYNYWKEFYIPFYKSIFYDTLNFDELTYSRSGRFLRVIANVNASVKCVGGYSFGGDVIINLDNMPEEYRKYLNDVTKYQYSNLGLLPQQGNLQGGKKKSGNDWRLDIFLKTVNDYYCNDDETILNRTKNRKNRECTIAVLRFLGSTIYTGIVEEENCNEEKIYNFCRNIYGISREMTRNFLECSEHIEPKEYCKLITDFWNERELLIRRRGTY